MHHAVSDLPAGLGSGGPRGRFPGTPSLGPPSSPERRPRCLRTHEACKYAAAFAALARPVVRDVVSPANPPLAHPKLQPQLLRRRCGCLRCGRRRGGRRLKEPHPRKTSPSRGPCLASITRRAARSRVLPHPLFADRGVERLWLRSASSITLLVFAVRPLPSPSPPDTIIVVATFAEKSRPSALFGVAPEKPLADALATWRRPWALLLPRRRRRCDAAAGDGRALA